MLLYMNARQQQCFIEHNPDEPKRLNATLISKSPHKSLFYEPSYMAQWDCGPTRYSCVSYFSARLIKLLLLWKEDQARTQINLICGLFSVVCFSKLGVDGFIRVLTGLRLRVFLACERFAFYKVALCGGDCSSETGTLKEWERSSVLQEECSAVKHTFTQKPRIQKPSYPQRLCHSFKVFRHNTYIFTVNHSLRRIWRTGQKNWTMFSLMLSMI